MNILINVTGHYDWIPYPAGESPTDEEIRTLLSSREVD